MKQMGLGILIGVALLAASCGTPPADDSQSVPTVQIARTSGTSSTTQPTVSDEVTEEPVVQPVPADTTEEPEPALAAVMTGSGVLAGRDFAEFEGMRVGIIVNQTSVVDGVHLIDLVNGSVNVELGAIFSPEHGVRGTADAGEPVEDEVDATTGAPIFSLYGDTRQPTLTMLDGLDVLIYDLQDVGTRHYTYISTMGLAMQTAAQDSIPFVVLDRPNPLGGDRLEGPIREAGLSSFIGQYPIPSVYGMTAGELALAIQGEKWLDGLEDLDLRVIPMENWTRSMHWPATGLEWIAPSPGLPSFESALIYPGTVLIEATGMSYGNGTFEPFTRVGAPWLDGEKLATKLNNAGLVGVEFEPIEYVPRVIPDMAPRPRLEGQELSGVSIRVTDATIYSPFRTGLVLFEALQEEASLLGLGSIVERGQIFDLLTGSSRLRSDLASGFGSEQILTDLASDLADFNELRRQYLLY